MLIGPMSLASPHHSQGGSQRKHISLQSQGADQPIGAKPVSVSFSIDCAKPLMLRSFTCSNGPEQISKSEWLKCIHA